MLNPIIVLEALERRRGATCGITASKLAMLLGCNERTLREAITALRMEGQPICGHPNSGYFMAGSAADISSTCAFLRSRAMTSLKQEARLRKIALPDLLGQMRIELEQEPCTVG